MMKRTILLLYLVARTNGHGAKSTVKGPPGYTSPRALRRILTSTVYTTVYPISDPPLAQPGDLASYGDGMLSDTSINAATISEYSSTRTNDVTLPPSILPLQTTEPAATQTFPVPLSYLLPQTQPDLSIHTVLPGPWHSVLTFSASTDSTTQTVSTVAVSPVAGSPTPFPPLPPTATNPTHPSPPPPTTSASNEAFSVPGLTIGTEGLPTTIPLAPASSAMAHCASLSGGIRTDDGINKGCASLFEHSFSCFMSNGPWDSPYDGARNEAYRNCVCMASDASPFTTYSALWKNFTGCAACVHSSVDFDVIPWLNLEARRLRDFCRSQEPNAFLFTLFFKNWYYRLKDYHNISDAPFMAASEAGDYGGEMAEVLQHFTGRPPMANIPWGPSAPPSGQYADVSPIRSIFVTTIETQGVVLTTPASRLVSWVPTKAGATWVMSAANVQESAAVDQLLSSALCLGERHQHCQINEAAKETVVWSSPYVWTVSLGLAVVIGWAALLL